MKKLLFIGLMATMAAGSVQAGSNGAGCGLGSMVFNGKSGIAPQVLAATTNGTSANQTFGITSGTLGCSQDGTVSSTAKLTLFTGSNMEKLASDMSQGQGEALESMAVLMGVEQQDKAAFFAATQSNFGKIFASEQVTAASVLGSLKEVLAADAQLSRYAKAI